MWRFAAAALAVAFLAGCASAPGGPEISAAPAAPAAEAQIPLHVLEEGGTAIRLMPSPCADPRIVSFVIQNGPQYAATLRAIESTWQMQDGSRQDIAGCWIELAADEGGGEELFVLLFADGDRYVVPKSRFTRHEGAAI